MPNILHLLHVPLALVALILASILHAETKLSDRLFHTASFGLLLMITVDFFLDVCVLKLSRQFELTLG